MQFGSLVRISIRDGFVANRSNCTHIDQFNYVLMCSQTLVRYAENDKGFVHCWKRNYIWTVLAGQKASRLLVLRLVICLNPETRQAAGDSIWSTRPKMDFFDAQIYEALKTI